MSNRFFRIRKIARLVLSVAVISIAWTACTGEKTNISDLKLCKSIEKSGCKFDSHSFDSSQPLIYCSFVIHNAKTTSDVKIAWHYQGDRRVLIKDTLFRIKANAPKIQFQSSLNKPLNGWPRGIYEVEISLEEEKLVSVVKSFSIK